MKNGIRVYLAVDLGAESGRVIAGIWNGRKLMLEQIHRFPNGGIALGEGIRWNVLGLWSEIQPLQECSGSFSLGGIKV
jgi:rhamnulokinase